VIDSSEMAIDEVVDIAIQTLKKLGWSHS